MMNIVGNQIIHEAADHYGWKEGSTEKLLLHGAIGALTGSRIGKRERICFGIHRKNKRKKLDGHSP